MIPTKITRDFSVEEFDCHDGTETPVELQPHLSRLVRLVLQPIRTEWTASIIVVSGYRTPEYNRKVGGAQASTHLTAEGADIRPVHLADVERLYHMILEMHKEGALPALGGLGEYPRWVHVDTRKRPDGRLRRWSGKGVGSEP